MSNIVDGKYKLVATQNGVSVIENETGKQVFFIKDDRDFSMFKRGDIYVIGCLTLDAEAFEKELDAIKKFQETVLPAKREELENAYKTNPAYIKMIEKSNNPTQQ